MARGPRLFIDAPVSTPCRKSLESLQFAALDAGAPLCPHQAGKDVIPAPVSAGPMNHLALPTADPERGAQFYCDVLGFVRTSRPAFDFRGAWLLRPEVGVMIHLIHDEHFRSPENAAVNSRGNHFAMQVEDFDEAVRRLTDHGVQYVVRILPDYNYRQAFFHDPDGNVVELGEWPSPNEMFRDLVS